MIFNKQTHLSAILLTLTYIAAYTAPDHNIKQTFELTSTAPILSPSPIEALTDVVIQAAEQRKKIALVGANKSQGGQTMNSYNSSLRISLEKLNKLISLNLRSEPHTA